MSTTATIMPRTRAGNSSASAQPEQEGNRGQLEANPRHQQCPRPRPVAHQSLATVVPAEIRNREIGDLGGFASPRTCGLPHQHNGQHRCQLPAIQGEPFADRQQAGLQQWKLRSCASTARSLGRRRWSAQPAPVQPRPRHRRQSAVAAWASAPPRERREAAWATQRTKANTAAPKPQPARDACRSSSQPQPRARRETACSPSTAPDRPVHIRPAEERMPLLLEDAGEIAQQSGPDR